MGSTHRPLPLGHVTGHDGQSRLTGGVAGHRERLQVDIDGTVRVPAGQPGLRTVLSGPQHGGQQRLPPFPAYLLVGEVGEVRRPGAADQGRACGVEVAQRAVGACHGDEVAGAFHQGLEEPRLRLRGPFGGEVGGVRQPPQGFALERDHADEHGHPPAVTVQVLLRKGRGTSADGELVERPGVGVLPAGRCEIRPPQRTAVELVPAVAQHGQERVVGFGDGLVDAAEHGEHVHGGQPLVPGSLLAERLEQTGALGDVHDDEADADLLGRAGDADGNVAGHPVQQPAGVAVGCGELHAGHRAVGQGAPHGVLDATTRLAPQVGRAPPEVPVPFQAVDPAQGRVDVPQPQVRIGPAEADRRRLKDRVDDGGGMLGLLLGGHPVVDVGDRLQPLDDRAVLGPDRGGTADDGAVRAGVRVPEAVLDLPFAGRGGAVAPQAADPVPVVGVDHLEPSESTVMRPRLPGPGGEGGLRIGHRAVGAV
nr:hypothetical protein [Couchioplanes caeruleus]